jgi:hypothetical protein
MATATDRYAIFFVRLVDEERGGQADQLSSAAQEHWYRQSWRRQSLHLQDLVRQQQKKQKTRRKAKKK